MCIYIYINTNRRANGICKYIYIHNSLKNYLIYIYTKYIYRRSNGIYIPKSSNLQHMNSLSLFYYLPFIINRHLYLTFFQINYMHITLLKVHYLTYKLTFNIQEIISSHLNQFKRRTSCPSNSTN